MRWRDIRTGLTVVTHPPIEPVSRAEAKRHCEIDHADSDHLVDIWIRAARRQLEKDTGRTPVNTVYDLTVDRFPEERYIPFPRLPVGSVTSVTSYDEDDAATTFSSGDYRLDTALNRLVLNDDATWPSDLRRHSAGVIRFTAGNNGTSVSISTITVAGSDPDAVATVTTGAAHGFSTGDRVTVAGAAQDALNGTFEVTVTGATTFTYSVVSGTPANGSGTMTARLLYMPEEHRLAMLLLIGHFAAHREAVVGDQVVSLPMGYEALIGGADRIYAMA